MYLIVSTLVLKIFRCRFVDEVIGSCVLNILLDVFHLNCYRPWVLQYRVQDKRGGPTSIIDNSVEHCVWLDFHCKLWWWLRID